MSSQQPIDVYPNYSVMKQQPTSSSNSNGSFGPVFIVLGVVAFVSVVACVLGRFCSRRRRRPQHHHHRAKESHSHHHQNQQKPITATNNKVQQQSHVGGGLGPKEWESVRQNPSTLDHHDHIMMRSSSGPGGGDDVDDELGGGTFHNKFKFPSRVVAGGGGRDKLPHHGRTAGHSRPEVRFADNNIGMHRGV